MNRQLRRAAAVFLSGLTVLTGCVPKQPFYLHERGDLSSYMETAGGMEHPDVEFPSLDEVKFAQAPLTLRDPEPKEMWDVSLEEAIGTALTNSKVIRQLGGAVAIRGGQRTAPENLLRFSDQANTIYQPALQNSSTLNFGGNNGIPGAGIAGLALQGINGTPGVGGGRAGVNGQGVEDALAAYDAHFSTSVFWNTTDRPQNLNPFQAGADRFSPFILQDYQASHQAQLASAPMGGTEWYLRSRTNYERGNSRGGVQALASTWTQELEVEARHPLLRGNGTLVNRVPIVIARTNEDIALADFEVNVRNLVSDVEQSYWDLYSSYRDLEAAKTARDSLLLLWRNSSAELLEKRGTIQQEAQAREQYLNFKAQTEESFVVLLTRERHLRYLLGLTSGDCRLIRPKDDPTTAHIGFEWCEVQAEALARSAELRRHKWRIKQRELELIYYRNQLLPQVDLVGLYRWVGLGDDLINGTDSNGPPFPLPGSSAVEQLTGGQFQEARFGVQMSPPQFGARRELARIRHQQMLLAESKAILEDLELTVLHRVTNSIVNADAEYHLAQTAFNRWVAAQQEVNARTEIVRQGGSTQEQNVFPNLLDSIRRQTDSQREYYQRLVNYNKAIADIHLSKGSLLEYDGVCLAEGPWPQKAYWDALGQARRRDASRYLDYGWTEPNVISRGPTEQFLNGPADGEMMESPYGVPVPAEGEAVPTPSPSQEGQPAPLGQPEQLPSPNGSTGPTLDQTLELPDDVTFAPNSGKRPNSGQMVSGAKFDWGDIGLEGASDSGVRQASATAELRAPQNPGNSAVQWMEPNRTLGAAAPISAGDWRAAPR